MVDDIRLMIATLARGEDAMSLQDFLRATNLPTDRVSATLDMLVAIHLFASETSYHASDIGEMVYSFADNDDAQKAYHAALEE